MLDEKLDGDLMAQQYKSLTLTLTHSSLVGLLGTPHLFSSPEARPGQ